MNVKEFLSRSYKDAQIVHERGDEITADDFQRGLRSLNYVLRGINLNKELITYRTQQTLNFVFGQEVYNVNFVDIDVIYFILSGSVRYVLKVQNIGNYFRRATVIHATGVPRILYAEPKPDFTLDISIYLKPFGTEPFTIHGRRALTELGINDTFPPEIFPYEMYLNYATGVRLRNTMGMAPNPGLNKLEAEAYYNLKSTRSYNTKVEGPLGGRNTVSSNFWTDLYLGGWF